MWFRPLTTRAHRIVPTHVTRADTQAAPAPAPSVRRDNRARRLSFQILSDKRCKRVLCAQLCAAWPGLAGLEDDPRARALGLGVLVGNCKRASAGGPNIVPTRASALGLCFLLPHCVGEEETQAQRARARRDKA